jgi:hypothetical protein
MESTITDTPLVNRVAQSGLITIDLEKYYPEGDIVPFDLKNYLFRELILREKDFREAMKEIDWSAYKGKTLAVYCSTDAIIPMWAYMLVATQATPYASDVIQCAPEQALEMLFLKKITTLDVSEFEGKRIVIKGCGDKPVPPIAYLEITRRLHPLAQSIMFGEPCSTVPVYKKAKE